MRAEHHFRQADKSWIFREFSDPADTIELKSVGCRLPLASLYSQVDFSVPV